MPLIERLQAAALSPTDWDSPGLMTDSAALLTAYSKVTKAIVKSRDEIREHLDRMVLSVPLADALTSLDLAIGALDEMRISASRDEPKNKALIRYDKMDPAKPPWRVKLEVCPNCRLPGKFKPGKKANTYIHTEEEGYGKKRRRHYCKLSHDGRRVDVVIPVT
jgi:hypothetical protein